MAANWSESSLNRKLFPANAEIAIEIAKTTILHDVNEFILYSNHKFKNSTNRLSNLYQNMRNNICKRLYESRFCLILNQQHHLNVK